MRLCPTCEIAYPDELTVCPRDGAPLPGWERIPSKDPLVGAIINQRYRLLERLGLGRSSLVYRAEHESLQAPVVIKLATTQPGAAAPEREKRFMLEARVLARLREGVPAILDFGVLRDGTTFVVMEPCRGQPLATLLHQGPLSVPRALAITSALASILQRAHGLGFVYGDLGADEVFVMPRQQAGAGAAGEDEVTLIDWGSAYALADSPHWPADAAALPRCCPPEAIAGALVAPAADQYQLAALTHQMLTGRAPSPAGLPLSPALPTALRSPLARALLERPGERYPTVAEFAAALDHGLQSALGEMQERLVRSPRAPRPPQSDDTLTLAPPSDPPLRFCPLCGHGAIDTDSYGASGNGRCTRCGTIFSVLASPARLPGT